MKITLDEGYNAMCDFVYLGYVGEVNARQISVLNYAIPEATAYKLKIEYPDKTVYEIPIKNGMCSLGASIFKTACEVKCQIIAYAVEGEVYKLVRKSDIFKQEIRSSIDETGIPSYEESLDALDKILQYESNSKEYAERAEAAAIKSEESESKSTLSALNASKSETAAAGYAKTAKTNADSTAADRQAVQTLAEQVTADKTIVVDNAAKVAEDRTAAETAAQTAQSIADSLPDDYVTAVGKIAENTAEIANVKLTDKELKRRVDALYSMGQGITHKFETDSETAYAKTVPTGAKLMSVKSVGGRSIVFNQMVDLSKSKETTANGVTFTFPGDGIVALNGTSNKEGNSIAAAVIKNMKDHKYLIIASPLSNVYGVGQLLFTSQVYGADTTGHGAIIVNGSSNATWYYTLYLYNGVTYDNVKLQPQIFDLTAMFGSGNEPTSVEEFEAMFPNDYYQYNAGGIVSAGTEEIVEQGKNIFEIEKCIKLNSYYGFEIDTNKTLQIALKDGKTCPTNVSFGIVYVHGNTMANWLITSNGVRETITNSRDMTDSTQIMVACYPGNKETMQSIADAFDIMLVDGIYKSDTMPTYAPYHRNEYPISEAIRNLPGYGWSAGTARNYVDYENKRYVQCVGSVNLGTLTWMKTSSQSSVGDYFYAPVSAIGFKRLGAFGITVHNILCSKYITVARNPNAFVDKTIVLDGDSIAVSQIQVKDTAYTDATAFKQAMSGVMLYYELANPIVTDISTLIPDDFLRNIEVEAGGSVTFKNSNGNSYRIPVPSEEEYIVKLSEVGGTT